MDLSLIDTQHIEAQWLIKHEIELDVLRLDKIHPVVSGNKIFKLTPYIQEACAQHIRTIATFGGAWSNHVLATAFATREAGLNSVGIIRGEKPTRLSYTLKMAKEYGMELVFVTRGQYKGKDEIIATFPNENWYWIDEGGYGIKGAKGAAEILKTINISQYTHIIAAVGTGTMLAGLILESGSNQTIIGISSMKGNKAIEQKIKDLTEKQRPESLYQINHEYHFGGFGKHPEALITFINQVYHQHYLPLDIIYTGKTFFAIKDLVEKSNFKPGSRLLMIHSGGLQGNSSLPAKVLAF